MIRKNPQGDVPVIHESSFVDPTAIICGKVIIHENVFIGPYVVIRADETNEKGEMEAIIVGSDSNIQDGVIIHSKSGGSVQIGRNTSIAHRSIVHGPCRIGDNVFVGFSSVLFNCTLGNRSVVRHNSVVEGCEIPEEFYIPSTTNVHSNSDLSRIPRVSRIESEFSESVARANHELVQGYKKIRNEF